MPIRQIRRVAVIIIYTVVCISIEVLLDWDGVRIRRLRSCLPFMQIINICLWLLYVEFLIMTRLVVRDLCIIVYGLLLSVLEIVVIS